MAMDFRGFDEPWLISAGLDKVKQAAMDEWERRKQWALARGEDVAGLFDTTEEREAMLLAEAQATALEEEKQFSLDKMASDENLAMEGVYSQAGTRGVEEPYRVAAARAAKDLRDDEMDEWEQAFLLSMMENMRGEDIGQAPAVVAGGGQRQWPSIMGQFAPWEQQKPYWWIT
tara:strand:- start:57 stop:575 length:519 start_codon:yes stop_codon:yes gene_type:complete